MTKGNYKWAVQNRKNGNVASTRESNYSRKAFFTTRKEARNALRTGRVYENPAKGRVVKIDTVTK